MRQVFRTNSSYARWEEARRTWGGVVNRSRDLLRQVSGTMHDLNNMAFGGLLHIVPVYAQLAAKQEPAGVSAQSWEARRMSNSHAEA